MGVVGVACIFLGNVFMLEHAVGTWGVGSGKTSNHREGRRNAVGWWWW